MAKGITQSKVGSKAKSRQHSHNLTTGKYTKQAIRTARNKARHIARSLSPK